MDYSNLLNVSISKSFAQLFRRLPQQDKEKILLFIRHVKKYGFTGLEGKNKASDSVPTSDPNWLIKVKYAQQFNLWHYHIGIPTFDTSLPFGMRTSQYILHYIKEDGFIKIIDLSSHPPFSLPATETFS